MMSTKVKLAGYAVILIFLLLCAELILFISFNTVPQLKGRFYSVPEVTETEYEKYIAQRHPVLGWPSEKWLDKNADQDGARRSPANKVRSEKPVCISLYGDSFTFSEEVSNSEAWGNLLAEQMNCQVKNYGVGGYGTDQALLRLQLNIQAGHAVGDHIVLGLYPDNLRRIHNQWRYLLQSSGGPALNFKPAFVRAEGQLALTPLFRGSYKDFRQLSAHPEKYLTGEGYLPNSASFYSRKTLGFPYTLSAFGLAKNLVGQLRLGSLGDRSNFWNYPIYYDTSKGPDAFKFEILAHILDQFSDVCVANQTNCFFLLIPDPELVYQREKTGNHDLSAPILTAMPKEVQFLDATSIFTDVDHICSSVTKPEKCRGHFNAAGYELLANFVGREISANIAE
ncbi:MAG: hypothetical protein AAF603_02145 [Pseudomonadota bacterium]